MTTKTDKAAASTRPKPKPMRVSALLALPPGVRAGIVLGAVLVGGTAYALGSSAIAFTIDHADKIYTAAETLWTKDAPVPTVKTVEKNRFDKPFFLSFYNGGPTRDIQTFEVTLKGWDEFTGEIVDLKSKSRGVIHGTMRAGALVLDYGSKNVDRPGYGVFVLREKAPLSDTVTSQFSGTGMVHHCECADGVVKSGPVDMVQAVTTNEPVPSADVLAKILYQNDPVPVRNSYFPSVDPRAASN